MPYDLLLLEKIPFMVKFYQEKPNQILSLGFLLENKDGVEISKIVEEFTIELSIPVEILKEMNEVNPLKNAAPEDIFLLYLNTFSPAAGYYKISVIDLIKTAELEIIS